MRSPVNNHFMSKGVFLLFLGVDYLSDNAGRLGL
jgi:hypothetical protein